jgi:pimeloyl-ACP methyl ester carboxylesterase
MPNVTSADGTELAYDTAGDGPLVILVDGALCFRDSGPMRSIAEQLGTDLTVLQYDRRGRGGSADTLPFAVEREVEDLEALIDAIDAPASLFGMSSGGALVLAAAAALGSKVSRIALYEPPYMPEQARAGATAYTAELTASLGSGDRDAAVAAFLRRVGTPDATIEGMRRSPAWPHLEALAPTLAYDDQLMGDSAVPTERIALIGVPVLTLAGGATPPFLQYGAATVADFSTRGEFRVIDNESHDVSPVALAAQLVPFFES